MGQQSNNCNQATADYKRLHQTTRHTVARADVEETESETKNDEIEAKSKRNQNRSANGHKMEKKAILYFAINRKNCSFYCFQSVFCFSEGAERGVAPVSAEKVCMWQGGRQGGGRHMAHAGQAMREKAKRKNRRK